jgi:hypothetical protein
VCELPLSTLRNSLDESAGADRTGLPAAAAPPLDDRRPRPDDQGLSGVTNTQYWVGGLPGDNAAAAAKAAALLSSNRQVRIL